MGRGQAFVVGLAIGAWLATAFISLIYFVAGDKETAMQMAAVFLAPGFFLVIATTIDPEAR